MTKIELQGFEDFLVKSTTEWFDLVIRNLEFAVREARDNRASFERAIKAGNADQSQDSITRTVEKLGRMNLRFDLAVSRTAELTLINHLKQR